MSVFASYARFYDLLYRDKDYSAEAAYVAATVRSVVPGAREVLELGSGTGGHAVELARLGFSVTGVDRSAEMVKRAQARGAGRFMQGDACSVRLGTAFDAVLALFHVVSYQTTEAQLRGILGTAAAHLRAGGAFFFDFWYGPAVLAEKPERRVKTVADRALSLTRVAEPVLREADHCVDVHYTVTGSDGGRALEPTNETHSMRYFFLPELDIALEQAGLKRVAAAEMPTGASLSPATWSAGVLARRS